MFWESEPFFGAVVSRREIGNEVAFAIMHLETAEGGPWLEVKNDDYLIPVTTIAIVRDYNTKIAVENAYNAKMFKARTFRLARKRRNSPVEIASCE